MHEESSYVDIGIFIVTAIGAFIAFVYGRREYQKSIDIKKAEFLDKLISDFLDQGTEIARHMLDDYVYVKKENRKLEPVEQKNVAIPLNVYLRDHKNPNNPPIGREDEFEVRNSFDKFLDFITKLSYFYKRKLISLAELQYFKYYLLKIDEKKDDLKDYIKAYFYEDDILPLVEAVKQK